MTHGILTISGSAMGVLLILFVVSSLFAQEPTGTGYLWKNMDGAVDCEHETQVESVEAKDGRVFLLKRQFLICGGERYRIERYLMEVKETGSKKITFVVKEYDVEGKFTLQLFVAPKIIVVPVEEK